MPSLLAATHRFGAFAFFASICTCSLIYVFFALPETAGRSLESMDRLFERPWYTVRQVAYPTSADLADWGLGEVERKVAEEDVEKATQVQIENHREKEKEYDHDVIELGRIWHEACRTIPLNAITQAMHVQCR